MLKWKTIARKAIKYFSDKATQKKENPDSASLYYFFDKGQELEILIDHISIRIANHGATLNNYATQMSKNSDSDGVQRNPSRHKNISVALKPEYKKLNHDNIDVLNVKNPKQDTFSVVQYVYNTNSLQEQDLDDIFSSLQDVVDGEKRYFVDPLKGTEKACQEQFLGFRNDVLDWNNYDQAQNGHTDESIDRYISEAFDKYICKKDSLCESRDGKRRIRITEQNIKDVVQYVKRKISNE